MNPFRPLLCRIAFGVVTVAIASAGLTAQSRRHLYLVTGFHFDQGPLKVGSKLLRVDLAERTLKPAADLVDASQGVFSVHADHDRRILAIMRSDPPRDVIVLSMDTPDMPRIIPVKFGEPTTFFTPNLIAAPGGGPIILMRSTTGSGPIALTGIDLRAKDPASAQTIRPWEDYRFVRTEGTWAPADFPNGESIQLIPQDGGLITRFSRSISQGNLADIDMGISIPGNLSPPANQGLFLAVNNDDMFVIDQGKTRGSGPPRPAGIVHLIVYDKRARNWSAVEFDKGGSSVRAFASWIVINEAEFIYGSGPVSIVPGKRDSPGKEFRQRILGSQGRIEARLDMLFSEGLLYFPGIMHLYDIKSKKKYTIKTGQGDSEILLVDGATVYYRVNDTLYRNEIGKSALGAPVEILKNTEVQLAHWAFLGP